MNTSQLGPTRLLNRTPASALNILQLQDLLLGGKSGNWTLKGGRVRLITRNCFLVYLELRWFNQSHLRRQPEIVRPFCFLTDAAIYQALKSHLKTLPSHSLLTESLGLNTLRPFWLPKTTFLTINFKNFACSGKLPLRLWKP